MGGQRGNMSEVYFVLIKLTNVALCFLVMSGF